MGKTKSKQEQIGMVVKAFIKVRFDGQKDASTLSRKVGADKTQPLAMLIDTETRCDSLQAALNAAITGDPGYKDGEIKIVHKGGSVIPVFSLKFKEVDLVFRFLPDGPYISSYKNLQKEATVKHLPQQHLITDFSYRNSAYHLELMEYCDKGSLEEQAKKSHAELIKNKQQLLLNYSMNILEILIDFMLVGQVFPDIKPSNFLVTHDGRVVISDIKTLLDVQDKESVLKLDVQSTPMYESGSGLVRGSQGMVKSESFGSVRSKTMSVDEIELKSRYMVGVTLYELATGHMVAKELVELQRAASLARDEAKNHHEQIQKKGSVDEIAQAKAQHDATDAEYRKFSARRPHTEMNFSQEVFNKGVGLTLKTIIQSFTNEDRSNRMNCENALELLAALPGAKARKCLDVLPVAASSAATHGDVLAASSASVTHDEDKVKKNLVEKKRGFFRVNRTSSSATVVDPKKKVGLLSELSSELSSRKSPANEELETISEETSLSPREKTGKENAVGKTRTAFKRARTTSSPAVVDQKIKKSEDSKSSEALQKFSVFQEPSPPSKSSKGRASKKNGVTSSASDKSTEAVLAPAVEKTKVTERESSPRSFFRGSKLTVQSGKAPSQEEKAIPANNAAHSSSSPSQ